MAMRALRNVGASSPDASVKRSFESGERQQFCGLGAPSREAQSIRTQHKEVCNVHEPTGYRIVERARCGKPGDRRGYHRRLLLLLLLLRLHRLQDERTILMNRSEALRGVTPRVRREYR